VKELILTVRDANDADVPQAKITGPVADSEVTARVAVTEGRELTRVIPATADTPARAIQFNYNADGQRASQVESGDTSAKGTISYRYDAQGRLIELNTPQGKLSYAYDAAGRITERSTSEGTTRHEYDGDGRLAKVTAPDGSPITYAYDAAGRQVKSEQVLSASTKLVTERRYDASDREIAIAHSKLDASGTSLIAGQAISRGQGGAVSRIDTYDNTASFDATAGSFAGHPSRVQVFGYDANARLTSEKVYKGQELAAWLTDSTKPATKATSYGYDLVGNRAGKTVATPAGTESTAYVYDANDRLTSETLTTATGSTVTTTYTWDGNGNLKSKQSPSDYTAYVFDANNRLIEVKRGATEVTSTTVAKYGYDADGQRISKTSASGTTLFLIDPTTTWPHVALESRGTQRTMYVWAEQLRQQVTGSIGALTSAPSEDLVPLQGHLGTTIEAIDRSGNAVERYEAGAFGELANMAPRLSHQYAGEYWDGGTELSYLRARWYASTVAILLSVDPERGQDTDPRTGNRYAYANTDPANFTDPSGRFGLSVIAVDSVSSSTVYRSAEGQRAGQQILSFRNSICRSINAIGNALPRHHVLPRGLGGRRDFGSDVVEALDASIHRQFHSLLNLAFVMNGLPGTANTDREVFRRLFSDPATGSRDRIRARRIVLDVTGYVDRACTAVRGYSDLTPKLRNVLRNGLFDF
jgi:RHS repeat-associated protein